MERIEGYKLPIIPNWINTNGLHAFTVSNEEMTPENLAKFTELFATGSDVLIGTGNKILEVYAQLRDSSKVIVSIDYAPCVINQILLIHYLQSSNDPKESLELFINYHVRDRLPLEDIVRIEAAHEDFRQKSIEFVKSNTKIIGDTRADQLVELIEAKGKVIANIAVPDYLGKLSRDTGDGIKGSSIINYSYLTDANRRNVILDGFTRGNIRFYPIDLSQPDAVERLNTILGELAEKKIALYFSNTLEVLQQFDGGPEFASQDYISLPSQYKNIISLATSTSGSNTTREGLVSQPSPSATIETVAGDQGFKLEVTRF